MRNILNILKAELLHNLHDSRSMTMMILLPIVFMLILGSALSRNFSPKMSKMEVLYTIKADSNLSAAFQSFIRQAGKQGIVFTKAGSEKNGLDKVKDRKYICFVKVTSNPDRISFYKNSRFSFEAGFMEVNLNTFVQRYNALAEIAKTNPAALQEIQKNTDYSFVRLVSLKGKRTPDAKSYYGITMTTMIIFYAMYAGAFSIKREKYRRTGTRLICSPVKRHEIFIGKIIGGLLVTFLQIAAVFLFSIYIEGAYWGSHIGTVILILSSEAVCSLSIGLGISLIFRSDKIIYGVMNIIPMLFAFLGGSFFSIDGIGNKLLRIADISPIRWVNQSIMGVVYGNDFSKVFTAVAVNLGIAFLFLAVSSYLFRKEALQP